MIESMIFSATAGKDTDTLLWKNTENSTVIFKQNNTDSLQKAYNKAIDFAIQENVQNLILVHDDVILENLTDERLAKLFKKYDVVGCAGTTEVDLKPPALWHLMGGGFGSKNLHGAVAHGNETEKHMTPFGSYPHRVVIIDGVFMAIKREVFQKIRFDESCPSKWHFYDLDYSMQCHKAGFKVGVGDIMVTHNSPGLTSFTEEFNKGQEWFLNKWKSK
jgi:GT2 family glycosyltransferase|tara:strand:+ start:2064 stop:2717 length:654 start_codon:yes stop_codon:yes gene_type:complete